MVSYLCFGIKIIKQLTFKVVVVSEHSKPLSLAFDTESSLGSSSDLASAIDIPKDNGSVTQKKQFGKSSATAHTFYFIVSIFRLLRFQS